MKTVTYVLMILSLVIAFVFRYITNNIDAAIWQLLIAIFMWIAIIGTDIRDSIRKDG